MRDEVSKLRIGELSARTGIPRRLLRYYEEQGLVTPDRSPSGYREYDERCVDRVLQIRGLLDAGLPTRIIKQILPCLTTRTIHVAGATRETIATLERERDRMTERIYCLTRNRDAISSYLDAVRDAQQHGALDDGGGSAGAAAAAPEAFASESVSTP